MSHFWQIKTGDCLRFLNSMEPESVHCVVTSPPYWGLRDYGVPGGIGMEATPEEYIESLTAGFLAVHRVLRDDGTLWLNLGDCYSGSGKVTALNSPIQTTNKGSPSAPVLPGSNSIPAKNLFGFPWRVALSLQATGWILRSDIIWAKPNPMPESVKDRPTQSHKYVFLFAKSPKYYYDAMAVRDYSGNGWQGNKINLKAKERHKENRNVPIEEQPEGANLRDVWPIAVEPYKGAHTAVFPTRLSQKCILAGTSAFGVCSECGNPKRRLIEHYRFTKEETPNTKYEIGSKGGNFRKNHTQKQKVGIRHVIVMLILFPQQYSTHSAVQGPQA